MKLRLIVLAAVLAAVIAGLAWFATTQSKACPGAGTADTGPVELKIATVPARVQACFGDDCEPHPVRQNPDGRWLVPQEPPYLPAQGAASSAGSASSGSGQRPGAVTRIRVVVKETGKRQRDAVFEIPTANQPPAPGSQCPGPASYLPVAVP
ncbi:hypothetical protein AAHB33_19710 [Paenarthrobacter sp. S56]|uniref:hypothetical protein n=1 Tax=Paenarthrobacter sp. S56 TaxID=3138179 RepID=UPI003219F973